MFTLPLGTPPALADLEPGPGEEAAMPNPAS